MRLRRGKSSIICISSPASSVPWRPRHPASALRRRALPAQNGNVGCRTRRLSPTPKLRCPSASRTVCRQFVCLDFRAFDTRVFSLSYHSSITVPRRPLMNQLSRFLIRMARVKISRAVRLRTSASSRPETFIRPSVPIMLPHFHQQLAEHVLAFRACTQLAGAVAPIVVVPVVALDQHCLECAQQLPLWNAGAELLHQQITHDADLDFFPIRPQLELLAHLLRHTRRDAVEDEFQSLPQIEGLRRLICVLDRWICDTIVCKQDFTGREVTQHSP